MCRMRNRKGYSSTYQISYLLQKKPCAWASVSAETESRLLLKHSDHSSRGPVLSSATLLSSPNICSPLVSSVPPICFSALKTSQTPSPVLTFTPHIVKTAGPRGLLSCNFTLCPFILCPPNNHAPFFYAPSTDQWRDRVSNYRFHGALSGTPNLPFNPTYPLPQHTVQLTDLHVSAVL